MIGHWLEVLLVYFFLPFWYLPFIFVAVIVGLLFLEWLSINQYFIFYIFSPVGNGAYPYEEGIIELYHIEECMDRHCPLNDDESSF